MKDQSENLSKFTGLIVTFHDNSSYELALLEHNEGSFVIEDGTLKVQYEKDEVFIQRGFPLVSMRNYEIYFSEDRTEE